MTGSLRDSRKPIFIRAKDQLIVNITILIGFLMPKDKHKGVSRVKVSKNNDLCIGVRHPLAEPSGAAWCRAGRAMYQLYLLGDKMLWQCTSAILACVEPLAQHSEPPYWYGSASESSAVHRPQLVIGG
jgi:hypothetical protein